MNAPRYVFVNDQGRVFSSLDEPTNEDFEYAAVGMVTIIRVADLSFYGVARQWRQISPGSIGRAEVDGVLQPPAHEAELICDGRHA